MTSYIDVSAEVRYLPRVQFDAFCDQYCANLIVDGGKCRPVHLLGREWINTGGCGLGNGKGWREIWAYPVVNLDCYAGPYQPLEYGLHYREVDRGLRPRSYEGMILKAGPRTVVVAGPKVTFRPSDEGEQLSLF